MASLTPVRSNLRRNKLFVVHHRTLDKCPCGCIHCRARHAGEYGKEDIDRYGNSSHVDRIRTARLGTCIWSLRRNSHLSGTQSSVLPDVRHPYVAISRRSKLLLSTTENAMKRHETGRHQEKDNDDDHSYCHAVHRNSESRISSNAG